MGLQLLLCVLGKFSQILILLTMLLSELILKFFFSNNFCGTILNI